MDMATLSTITAAQYGLFTRAQAASCGFTNRHIRSRLASGRWRRVVGSVLAEAELAITPALRDRAAHLAVDGSVLIGPSAARLWGLEMPDERSFLGVSRQVRAVPGVYIQRVRLAETDIDTRDGLPVTSRLRTVLDCLLLLPQSSALDLLERARQLQWITVDDLARHVNARVGHRGVRTLVKLMGRAISADPGPSRHPP